MYLHDYNINTLSFGSEFTVYLKFVRHFLCNCSPVGGKEKIKLSP